MSPTGCLPFGGISGARRWGICLGTSQLCQKHPASSCFAYGCSCCLQVTLHCGSRPGRAGPLCSLRGPRDTRWEQRRAEEQPVASPNSILGANHWLPGPPHILSASFPLSECLVKRDKEPLIPPLPVTTATTSNRLANSQGFLSIILGNFGF